MTGQDDRQKKMFKKPTKTYAINQGRPQTGWRRWRVYDNNNNNDNLQVPARLAGRVKNKNKNEQGKKNTREKNTKPIVSARRSPTNDGPRKWDRRGTSTTRVHRVMFKIRHVDKGRKGKKSENATLRVSSISGSTGPEERRPDRTKSVSLKMPVKRSKSVCSQRCDVTQCLPSTLATFTRFRLRFTVTKNEMSRRLKYNGHRSKRKLR